MIDPRISMAVQQASVLPAMNTFTTILDQQRQMALDPLRKQVMEQQLQQGQQQIDSAALNQERMKALMADEETARDMRAVGQFSLQNKQAIDEAIGGNMEPLKQAIVANQANLPKQNVDEAMQAILGGQGQRVAQALSMTPQIAGLAQQEAKDRVTSTKILDDGTTIQAMSSGGTRVVGASGQELQGPDRVAAIAAARASEVEQRRKIKAAETGESTKGAGKTKALQSAVTKGTEAYDKIAKLNTAISNYDEVVRLVDAGAQTGVISSKLPSFKAASIELDNLQGSLGLDVIGNTTFGALSGSELQFALDTALPKKLEGEDLKQWVRAKKRSHEKLRDYLSEAATFLSSGENTIADFLQKKQAEKILSDTPEITTDPSSQMETPQGNKIGRFTIEVE